ncbi:MAG TPA: SpvB/TcaC N-terminal domain-containing protein, partial [Ramlibacter sp.]|uniref:SpvB/TcaC N-terminal domain-containing protein n=1 Tax=Ramlibacter sp. TaxID=1917967 RepID=UPI002ED5BB07
MVSPSLRPFATLQDLVRRAPAQGRWLVPALLVSFGIVSLTRAVPPSQETLKITPLAVRSASDDAQVRSLFDRDTTTMWQAQGAQQVTAQLDAPVQVRAIAVYGPAAYVLNVQAQSAAGWQPVPGLQNVNLATLPERWNTLAVPAPLTAAQLRFDLTPVADSAAGGLKELEIRGAGDRSFVATPQQLLAGLETKAPPLQGRLYVSPQKPGVIGDDGRGSDDPSDNRFFVEVDRDPARFRRAWLVYEASGITHWTSGMRAINGNAVQGDWMLPRAQSWSTQLEEINPAWLQQGANRVEFSAGVAGSYGVRNVRLMGELEDGTNFVGRVEGSGAQAALAYDGDAATGWSPYAGLASGAVATLDAHFDKPTQVGALKLQVTGGLTGQVAVSFRVDGNWIDSGYTAFNAATLVSGWNELNYPSSLPVEGMRLSFMGGASSTGQVRELIVSGAGVGPRDGKPALRIGYPDAGQFVGRQAYIRGFATPIDNGSGPARIEVGGQEVQHTDGAFGAVVAKDDVGLSAQADKDPWSVDVVATYRDGAVVRQTVQLKAYSEPVVTKGKDGLATMYAPVPPGKARKLAYAGAELQIGADALDQTVNFGMTPLREQDIPRLDTGMTNVTKGPPRGFRFTPHGSKFRNKIKVVLPYERNSLPPGHRDDDVRTFYFDDQAGMWKPLERVQVDAARGVVVSYTDHFTDMINATITVPDHPNPASLNPTSIKDIKAADPGAQVNLVEPPRANNMGDARLAYPIELAPGRNGLQPSLAVQYNSGGGNGWMGMGWDLAMQSVSIDTRWGVPRYDAALETETYTLDGESLTPVAHRGELRPRSAGKVFHTRIEGQFRRIVRHGGAPNAYWWEVTDKNGTRFFYGGRPEGGQDANAVLAEPGKGNVFRWALKEVRDTNGNTIVYTYDVVNGGAGGEPWRQIYLKRINYTGRPGVPGPYEVSFQRSGGRTDVMVDGRPGFKTVMDQRLVGIDVSLTSAGNPLIRRYKFDYVTGAFKKTLLTKVTQYGEDGVTAFNNHAFEYFDEARDAAGAYHGFSPARGWGVGNDNIDAGLMDQGLASAVGGTVGTNIGGHLYVGVGSGSPTSKIASAGVKVGYSEAETESLITMADMNGDGLPDKVFRGGGGFTYRPNLSGPRGRPVFGEPVSLPSLPAISREKVTSTTIGGEIFLFMPIQADHHEAINESDTYFTDVNGDGLTDIVSGGRVLFGYVNAAGVPTFSPNSTDTPVAIGASVVDGRGLLPDLSRIQTTRAANFPMLDTLRRWVAPYDGTVQIDGAVRLVQDTSPKRAAYTGADGVRVAIQLEGAELWSARIEGNDYAAHAPAGVSTVPVRRGDRLYFRVQSVFNGAYDQVAWDAQVRYLNVDLARTDVNNLPVYAYGAARDFTLAGRKAGIPIALAGTVRLAGVLEKTGATTDDVTLAVLRNGTEVSRRTLAAADTGVLDLAQDLTVAQGDVLDVRVLVDSPIDAARVKFAPKAYYIAAAGVTVTDNKGNYVVQVPVRYDMDLYPVDKLTAPQAGYVATAAGNLPVQAVVQLTGLPAGQKTSAVLTVKRRGQLLGKRTVEFNGTGGAIEQTVSLDVAAAAGDELFFDLSSRDAAFAGWLAKLDVKANGAAVPSALHTPSADELFPQPYRGWGVVGYNGDGERATRAIDQSLLGITENTKAETLRVYPFLQQPAEARWGGMDAGAWAGAEVLSSSRMGLDDIRVPTSDQFAGAGAVSRISQSENDSVTLGITGSKGSSKSLVDYQDLNGDRFPDVIGNGGVQYTRMTGPLEASTRGNGLGSARESDNETYGASTDGAGNVAVGIANFRGYLAGNGTHSVGGAKQGMDMPSLGFSASIGQGTTEGKHDLLDINGDGLPDKVYADGTVALNLGYRFGIPEAWGGGQLNEGKTINVGGGATLGYQKDFLSWGGGLNLSVSETKTKETYLDINGDGLPDKLIAGNPFTVRLNTGNGYGDSFAWPSGQGGKVSVDKQVSLGGGVFITVGFSVALVKVVVNPGLHAGVTLGRPEYVFRDMDGDGYVDYVHSEKDSELNVAGNFIGRTHLLKRVVRPLGASMEFDYTRDGNTYNQPHSKWTLTRVAVNDGHAGDGVDTLLTTYDYQDGFYDRAEREFYGYSKVVETQRDVTQGESAYRRNTSEYLNRAYATKGLLARTVMEDAAGRAFTESKNQYDAVAVADGAAVPGDEIRSATVFPQLVRMDHAWYEGTGSAGKQTYTTHRYDEYGNVVEFFDAGDVGADDDVRATIAYTRDTTNWIVGKPTSIRVEGAGRLMRSREATYSPGTANLVQVRQFLENGDAAVTDLGYNVDGTLANVLGPVNHRNQRYRLEYSYDPVVSTHIVGIVDSFGLGSSATHHYKYGKVLNTTDTNNNPTDYTYDQFGRTTTVTGPYQTGTGQATLRMEYHPEATVPWARTRHLDVFRNAADPIDTVLFTDGLKRVVQTKKDISLFMGATSAPVDVMSVSGRVLFDAVGRSVAQYYPVTEPLGNPGAFNAAFDTIQPTRTEYDVMDRTTRTVLPDDTVTTMQYGFGGDRDGLTQFRTIVTDANGKRKASYRDVQEQITSVQEFLSGQTLWTSYRYDPLKQIVEVKDDRGNLTQASYDNLGRRIALDNPDTGKT